jgi:ADP-ribosylglycohydrolase
MNVRSDQITGVILGTAVGDALGLPREGLSPGRAQALFGGPPFRQRFVLGRGMVSDDTEHTCMVGQALLRSAGDPAVFSRSLAWRLRGWMLGMPAGVGLATARAIIKLWVGFRPESSGVWSAGNGPAMRAAIIGVYATHDTGLMRRLIRASTRLTHVDPAAEHGAIAVALAAACGSSLGPTGAILPSYVTLIQEQLAGTPLVDLLTQVCVAVESGSSFEDFLLSMKLDKGISGYVNHTVPAAVFCWLKWPSDFRAAVEAIVQAGGDADSTGAIVGGLVGATSGAQAIPDDWLNGLWDWPRSTTWLRCLASVLNNTPDGASHAAVPLCWPALIPRNLLFLAIVLARGLRRLLPPY